MISLKEIPTIFFREGYLILNHLEIRSTPVSFASAEGKLVNRDLPVCGFLLYQSWVFVFEVKNCEAGSICNT